MRKPFVFVNGSVFFERLYGGSETPFDLNSFFGKGVWMPSF